MEKGSEEAKISIWQRLRGAFARRSSMWSEKRWSEKRPRGGASGSLTTSYQASRYTLIQNEALADHYFSRLLQSVYRRYRQEREHNPSAAYTGQMLWESGRLNPGRAYFYLKPLNELGWLFERSGLGWVIARSEKIVGQSLFLRQNEAWDIASLYEALSGEALCRVSSQLTGGDLIGFAVYEKLLLAEIWTAEAAKAEQSLREPLFPAALAFKLDEF